MGVITITSNAEPNNPPSRSGYFSFNLDIETSYVFTKENFTTETLPSYLDPEGDEMESIKIKSLPTVGSLKKNGTLVSLDDEITGAELDSGALVYESQTGLTESYNDSGMTFVISDVGSSTFTLSPEIVYVIATYVENNPPTQVGDNSVELEVGEEFVFTRASLTSQLLPPYEDPEGNPASRLRIDVLPNTGTLTLSGANCYQGQIVNFSDIDLGLLKYKSNQVDESGLEGFSFSISDTGSEQFKS